ncbi:MAG: hypothetical protein ACRC33_03340 [Gemmataceae bacterium]
MKAAEVFRKDGRSVPVFNGKHLSWDWDWAKETVATARFEACLRRSQTLGQRPGYSHLMPTAGQMRELAKAPVAYRIGYADGLKATVLLTTGLVEAGVRSLAEGQKRLETPHLAVRYAAPKGPPYARE